MANPTEHYETDDEAGEEAPEAERAGEYEQSGSLGTGTQGDSIARELADRDSSSDVPES
jgi:hypothetical protein